MSYAGKKSSASSPGPPSPIPPPATVSMVPPPVVVLEVAAGVSVDVHVPQAPAGDCALKGPVGSASQFVADVCVWTSLTGSQEPDVAGGMPADAAGRDALMNSATSSAATATGGI